MFVMRWHRKSSGKDTTFSVCDDRPEMRSQSVARPAGKGEFSINNSKTQKMKIIKEIEKGRLTKQEEDIIRGGMGGCLYNCAPTFSQDCVLYTECGGNGTDTYKLCLSTSTCYESCIDKVFKCKIPV